MGSVRDELGKVLPNVLCVPTDKWRGEAEVYVRELGAPELVLLSDLGEIDPKDHAVEICLYGFCDKDGKPAFTKVTMEDDEGNDVEDFPPDDRDFVRNLPFGFLKLACDKLFVVNGLDGSIEGNSDGAPSDSSPTG